MKLYIAKATCSLAVQLVANELGLAPELVHFDVFGNGAPLGSANKRAHRVKIFINIDTEPRRWRTS